MFSLLPSSLRSRRLLFAIGIVIAIFVIYRFVISPPKKLFTETAKVTRTNLEEKLTISGEIDADQKATLRFVTGGQISWVGVKEGDFVKKFQAIASLDRQSLQKSLSKYLNTYQKTRNAFDQAHADNKDKVIDDTLKRTLDDYQLDLNSTVSDVEIQDLALKLSTLWTPISGIVTRVTSPNAGVIISSPLQAEFDIVDPTSLIFQATADQTEITKIKVADEATMTLDSYQDESIKGQVSQISFLPKANETGTVYSVKVSFPIDNDNFKYRLGMTGDLTFIVAKKAAALSLPSKFVKSENGKKYVNLLVDNGRLKKTYVETGLETDTSIEITSGVSEGAVVTN